MQRVEISMTLVSLRCIRANTLLLSSSFAVETAAVTCRRKIQRLSKIQAGSHNWARTVKGGRPGINFSIPERIRTSDPPDS
jgi:hypothetical protein